VTVLTDAPANAQDVTENGNIESTGEVGITVGAEAGAAAQLPPTGVDLNGVQVWMAALGALMLVALLALNDRRGAR